LQARSVVNSAAKVKEEKLKKGKFKTQKMGGWCPQRRVAAWGGRCTQKEKFGREEK